MGGCPLRLLSGALPFLGTFGEFRHREIPKPGTALCTTDFVVEVRRALDYVCGMAQTIERRVEELEHKLADLTTQFADVKSRQKDWRRTFGLSRGDDGFKEMVSLGREYRRSLRDHGNGAGS